MDIGLIGTGIMGAAMGGHLLAAGHTLHVTTRSPTRAAPLLARGAQWQPTPAALAARCALVISMVGLPADVEAVHLGPDGTLAGAGPGCLLIDMTTSSPALAVRLAAAALARGGAALDAPVTGGEAGAKAATLSILVGGAAHDLDRARPVLAALGRTIVHLGGPGAGQHGKLANQVAIAGMMLGVCEMLAYARHAGIDPAALLPAVQAGAAGSWAMANLAPRMLAGDDAPGFLVRHFIKDLELAATCGLDLPGLGAALAQYRRLAAAGGGDLGTQALARWYQR